MASKFTVVVLIHQARKEFELRPVVPHDPVSAAMRERGTVTRMMSRQLIDTLAAGKEGESLSRIDTDETSGIEPPEKASTALPRRIQGPSDDIRS